MNTHPGQRWHEPGREHDPSSLRRPPSAATLLAMLGLIAGCAAGDYSALSTPQNRVRFQCDDGQEVEMRFFPAQGVGVLVRGGATLELQQQPSASGFIYSNGPNTVRGKGSELVIEIGRRVPIRCQARA